MLKLFCIYNNECALSIKFDKLETKIDNLRYFVYFFCCVCVETKRNAHFFYVAVCLFSCHFQTLKTMHTSKKHI